MSVLNPVRVGPLVFSHPLVLGAGTCKTLDDIKVACTQSAVSGIELGTITPHMRVGNAGKGFIAIYRKGVLLYTLNSLGMPNPGKDAVTTWAREALRIAHDKGKLLGINVAGDTPEEIVAMVLWAHELGFDWITINAGCPNKWKTMNGAQIPEAILSFDTGAIETLLTLLDRTDVKNRVWWKPSPENDTLGRFITHAKLIARSSIMNGWVANNTTPHCYTVDQEDGKSITAGGGLAGMGGPAVKPKSMGDLIQLSTLLPKHFTLVAAGGITDGQDIIDYRHHTRANILMFTSAYWAAGLNHRVAGEMLQEVADLEAA